MRFKLALGLAAGLRAGLLLWSTYQDANSPVPYTDVDYFVFSDAAACLVRPNTPNCGPAEGSWASEALGDPYARSTYRYTPLIALLLAPNTLLHPIFGKLLFALCDLLVGTLLYRLSLRRGVAPTEAANAVAAIWLLNPIIANISTRGSSESVVGAVVVTTLYLADSRRWDAAALSFGLAVHLKIFPVVYGSSLLTAMLQPRQLRRSFVRIVRFGAVSLSAFVAINLALYLLYVVSPFSLDISLNQSFHSSWGQPFLDETFLYHLRRLDHRHNFSPYFYPYYLAAASPSQLATGVQAFARHPLAAFVPQMGLCLILGAVLGGCDLPFAWLVQTCVFVTFNKVCTSQVRKLPLPSFTRPY